MEHKLHLHLGPNHLYLPYLDFTCQVSVFNLIVLVQSSKHAVLSMLNCCCQKLFHVGIFKSYFSETDFFFQNSPHKRRKFLLKALKISNANLSRLTSIVHLLVFFFIHGLFRAEMSYKRTIIKICVDETGY